MAYKYLSHILTNEVPVYGGKGALSIKKNKSISDGDSVNIFHFSMENHWGTHVDAPYHFFEDGKRVIDFQPEYWFFRFPQVINVTLNPSDILECGDWKQDIRPLTDILIFKSGWSKRREDREYCNENPGIHPEVGLYLRKNFPEIRAIGIDWISISPYKDRALGRESHKAFLGGEGAGNPVLLIEDMNLTDDLTLLRELVVMPIMVDAFDSAPCTIVGVFND